MGTSGPCRFKEIEMAEVSSQSVKLLFESQLNEWQQAKDNYEALDGIKIKESEVYGFNVKVQFNPARIVSSAAKVDAKSLKERKCFLCGNNRPAVQKGIDFKGEAGDYTVLVNPFPIFTKHLTIPDRQHVRQQIKGRYADMLNIAASLDDYLLFYNGPKCGASAPDHMHFQAGNKGFLPVETDKESLKKEYLCSCGKAKLYAVENFMRGTLMLESENATDADMLFGRLYNILPVKEGEWEPMLNLLTWYEKERGLWTSVVFLREKHRPSHYFAEGEKNILLSPASVDLGGVFITPLEKDFNKITDKELCEILDEIAMDENVFRNVKRGLKEQPVVTVGVMSGKEINFSFDGNFRAESCNGEIVSGNHSVKLQDGGIEWRGKRYDSLLFEPANLNDTAFWLKDVTIGVNFHWERKEDQKFGGSLKFIVEGDKLTAVNVIGVEDYLTSVISSEMSATASEELLEAHAVISRSWLLAQIEKNKEIVEKKQTYSAYAQTDTELIKWYDREDHTNFDVCADDHCQRYQGLTRASTAKVRDAIAATWGEVITSGGKICDARFSKCCGGVFEEFQNCWEPVKYPYLVKLRDSKSDTAIPDLTIESEAERWILSSPVAFCNTTDKKILSQVLNNYDQETVNFYRWRQEYGQKELASLILERSGIDYGSIIDLVPVERGTSGRLVKLKIVGTKRSLIIGKELEIRRTLSTSHLYSSAFVVRKEGSVKGDDGRVVPEKFTLIGAGWGHGVGLCQIGAAVMGEQGYNYKEILLHYYVGADIEKKY